MEKDRVYVRDARREDARDIAGLIVHAWPVEEFLKVRPGMTVDRFSEFLQRFVEADDTLYSYTVTKVAVVAGQDGRERVAGMMNGYDGALYGELKRPVIEALVKEFGSCGDFDKTVETSAGEFYLDSASVSRKCVPWESAPCFSPPCSKGLLPKDSRSWASSWMRTSPRPRHCICGSGSRLSDTRTSSDTG